MKTEAMRMMILLLDVSLLSLLDIFKETHAYQPRAAVHRRDSVDRTKKMTMTMKVRILRRLLRDAKVVDIATYLKMVSGTHNVSMAGSTDCWYLC